MITIKKNKLTILVLILLITVNITGCSNKEEVPKDPYVEYIITTYSGGEEIEEFEVWSDMGWYFGNNSIKVYDSPSENVLLFRTTLDYKLKRINP